MLEWLSTNRIRPAAPPRDAPRRDRLIESMRKNGWTGRPLLVIEADSAGGSYRALTGSHRYDAARKAPLDKILCHVIDNARWKRGGLDFETVLHLPEPERVTALRGAGLNDAAELCSEEIAAGTG